MAAREYSRIIIKRSTELGVQPTIPVNEEFSNEWNTTDLFVGELFMNTVDDRLWTRTNNGIVEIPMSGISSENFYTDSAYILSGTTLAFDRTNSTGSTLAYTVDLAPMFSAGTVNTYLTGGTLSGSTLKLTRNDGVDIEVVGFNTGSGSTFDCSDLNGCESFNNLIDRVNGLEDDYTDTGVIITGITADVSMAQADIISNSGRIKDNEGNISGLTSNIISVNQDIGDLTGRVSMVESDIIEISGSTGGGEFTGNTSANCIGNIHVQNIHGCSELTIHGPIQHNGCTASGTLSTAFGNGAEAINLYSHAQGFHTTASGMASHAQGENTVASGNNSHAQGGATIASGDGSHAGGSLTTASGYASHSGGRGGGPSSRVIATGDASFAHFRNTSGSYKGAMANQSAILGGLNHNIEANANQSAILGGNGNNINSNATNSVILGGSNITGTTSNTAYMEHSVNTGVHQFSEYTVSSVPSASMYAGGMIAVTDETDGYTMAFSDGTNWRRIQDREIIS